MSLEWLFLSMVPLVDVEIPLGAQALPTLSANERPSMKVDLLVGQQRGTLPKAPAALWALEGLLPLMDLLVGHESPILHKALPTLTAGERPLLRVRPHVDVEVDLCAQPLAAVGTEVGPTLGVRLPMGRQAYLQAEGTPALPAAEGPLSRVDALMGPQVAPGGETPPTLPTSKELLRRVDALVSLQVALLAEGLAALLAQVCLQHHMLHYGLHGSRALSDGAAKGHDVMGTDCQGGYKNHQDVHTEVCFDGRALFPTGERPTRCVRSSPFLSLLSLGCRSSVCSSISCPL